VCVRACVRACMRVRACVCVCVLAGRLSHANVIAYECDLLGIPSHKAIECKCFVHGIPFYKAIRCKHDVLGIPSHEAIRCKCHLHGVPSLSNVNVIVLSTAKSRYSQSSVQIQMKPKSPLEFVPRNPEESEFLAILSNVNVIALSTGNRHAQQNISTN